MKKLLIAIALLASTGLRSAASDPAPLSADQLKGAASATTQDLVSDYNSKNRRAFLKLLADDFSGDSNKLEDAIRQDFKLYSDVHLSLTQRTASVNATAQTVLVPFQYSLDVKGDYGAHNFSGESSFELAWEDGKMRLRKIGTPIFGQTSPEDFEAATRDGMQKLADAYTNKRRSAFMHLVSDDFLGDTSTFEDALMRDFRTYRSVTLQFFIDDVTIDKDLAQVDFHYNLAVVNASGNQNNFSGTSGFTFKNEGGLAKLYKMETPLIFGNSLPASENPLATSQGPSPTNTGTAPGAANPSVRGSAQLGPSPNIAFKFKTQTATNSSGSHDIFEAGGSTLKADNAISDIGSCNTGTIASAPKPSGTTVTAVVGHCYSVLTTEGLSAVFKVDSLSFTPPANTIIQFDYVFQPNGGSSF